MLRSGRAGGMDSGTHEIHRIRIEQDAARLGKDAGRAARVLTSPSLIAGESTPDLRCVHASRHLCDWLIAGPDRPQTGLIPAVFASLTNASYPDDRSRKSDTCGVIRSIGPSLRSINLTRRVGSVCFRQHNESVAQPGDRAIAHDSETIDS